MRDIHCRDCNQPICEHIQKWQQDAVDKLSRRNMQIRELKKQNQVTFSQDELRELDYWWNGCYTGSKPLHDKILKLLNR